MLQTEATVEVKQATEATLRYENGNIMQTLMEGTGKVNANINSVCVCVTCSGYVNMGIYRVKDCCRHFWTLLKILNLNEDVACMHTTGKVATSTWPTTCSEETAMQKSDLVCKLEVVIVSINLSDNSREEAFNQ
jgi:hypothetical protein